MYSIEFIEFVQQGAESKFFIGTGNPNAQILLVGKESAISTSDIQGLRWYNNNAIDWLNRIENNLPDVLNFPVTVDHPFRKRKVWGKNTWSKYQRLSDIIFNRPRTPNHIDFLENIFTTEINDSPSLKTSISDKSSLNVRKSYFKHSAFIQKFPIVVLACSNYFNNSQKYREIDEVFGVHYNDNFPRKVYNKSNWFYSHYNSDMSKLVIHTRQLSADVKSDLLNDIGLLIQDHLKKLNKLK